MQIINSVWHGLHSFFLAFWHWHSMSTENLPRNQITSTGGPKNNFTFQVIGAGLTRTGTFSTRIALTTLLGILD